MKYKLKVYSIWEYGQRVDSEGKPHQEDSIFPAYGQQKETDRLFILCDGMGGHEAGEVASSTVCTAMSNSILESVPDIEGDFCDDNLKKAIADAFNALDELPYGDVCGDKKMGTTMAFLKLHNKGCTIAHMGDSRVYHIRPGKGREETRILFKTNDHSLVNDLIKVKELTPEEAKLSKQKNIITRAMQPRMERHPRPDIYHTVDIKKGDYFYMCSDGMLEQMEDEHILFNFSDATGDDENKVEILTQATSQNLDNHSAIIVHVLDVIDPLPVPTTVVSSSIKPKPIMAEVDEDSLNEEDEVEGNIINVNNAGNVSNKKVCAKGKSKLGLYVSFLVLILILLVLGLFITSSKFSKGQDENPEKIERPQKPKGKLGKRHNTNNPVRGTSFQESSNKPNDASYNPNSGSQLENSPIPNNIHNVVSSHTNPSGNSSNIQTNGSSNGIGGGGHNHISSRNNLSHANNLHGEDVASSDQQAAIDAVNNGSRNPKK